jgi:CubicO group peptidase (beta-lactamase class C family)
MPGTSLKANRRALLRLQLPPPGLNPKLDRSQPNYDPVLARQLLTHDIGVAAMPEEALAQPVVEPIERRLALRLRERHRAAGTQIAPHRIAGAPELL